MSTLTSEVVAKLCRDAGARLMMLTAPLASSWVGVPLGMASFTIGWALQAVAQPGRSEIVNWNRTFEHETEVHLDEATAALLG